MKKQQLIFSDPSLTTGSLAVFEEKINRLYQVLDVHSDTELARALGITPPSVASARQKKLIPIGWIEKISNSHAISLDWLYHGRGPIKLEDIAQPPVQPSQLQKKMPPETMNLSMSTPLDVKLEISENERRELLAELRAVNAENRQWAAKMEQALRENADLRERCAKLEERQMRCNHAKINDTSYIESA